MKSVTRDCPEKPGEAPDCIMPLALGHAEHAAANWSFARTAEGIYTLTLYGKSVINEKR